MKKLLTSLALLPVLASCSGASVSSLNLPLQERLRNPLVAERYWSDMAEHMADYTRTEDPIMKDGLKAGIVEGERVRALERVAQARTLKKGGISGVFLTPTTHESVDGEVLLRENTLSFGTTFSTIPNPSIHIFLTTVVDPRDVPFPDKSSIDVGELQTAYGPQTYVIPQEKIVPGIRTAVLYDTRLSRIIGFAQLSK